MLMPALTLPDVKGCAPVSVTGKTLVLHVLEPVAKAALTDILGNPVYSVVILDKVVTHLGHLDEPSVASVVDKRGVTSPAVRIIVLELGCGEELALFFKVGEDRRVCLLHEETCVGGFLCHLTLAVNKLHEGKAVSSANLVIVLTNAGAICTMPVPSDIVT